MTFRMLGLMDPIIRALQEEGYTKPTPIQIGAIPPALVGRDVLGCAQTGTGKTCAFAAPILQRLNGKNGNPRQIKALVLTPTRELAIQIGESFAAYGRNLSLRCAVVFGGVGQGPQVDKLSRGVDILVATPGRLLDLHGQGLLDLTHIEIFVLDEADRMLDMGFIHDVRRILKLLPEQKQTLFFSATMPPEVMELVDALLHNYARVAVDPVSSPVEVIQQSLYFVDKNNKTRLLAHLLEERHIDQALVFTRTKYGANRVARDLERAGVSAAAIHGNKSQTARVQALGDFKAGKLRVLVATDIAARGIDIEQLGCVFNYNLPDVPETYVHRIGRTGRAGRDGIAISFCQFDEKDELKAIEKLLGKPIPVVEDHPYPMVNFDPPQKDGRGRPVNAEDQEARQAAASAVSARRSRAPAGDRPQPNSPSAPRGAADRKNAPRQAPAEKRKEGTANPAPAQEPLYPRANGGKAQRRGRLEDTMPREPAMPAVDFVKPNPLDSDVVLDATARLLAPKRSTAPIRGGEKKKKSAPTQDRPQKSAPAPAPKGRKKRYGKSRGPREIQRSLYAAHQKDSTEQHSLMKPYYISHDD